MHFEAFDAEDDVDAGVLHALAPTDVRRLVEAGEQLDDDGHFLPVAGGADEGFDHFGVFGQTVECCLDRLDRRVDGRLLEQPDVGVKAVVRHMEEAVALADEVEEAFGACEFMTQDAGPRGVFQVFPPTVGEAHEVTVVLVLAAGEGRVETLVVQLVHHAAQHAGRHGAVVDEPEREAEAPAFDTLRDFLEQAVAQVVVDFHLSILGEFEAVSLVVVEVEAREEQGQAAAHHVVEIHQVAAAVAIREPHEAPHAADWERKEGVVAAFDALAA